MSKAVLVISGQELSELRHNLRTPVNHILGYGEMLIEDAEAGSSPCTIKDLRSVHDLGRQLLATINSSLAPASNEVSGEGLREMHYALTPAINQILVRCRTLLLEMRDCAPPEDDEAASRAADLHRIQSAAERLLAMSEELLTGKLSRADVPGPLPAAPAPKPVIIPRAPAPAAKQRAYGHILVVDDNDSNRDVLCRRLEREGFAVDSAPNGRVALEMLRSEPFDLVLLDIMMPEIDGFEVLRQLKADAATSGICVIMISALDEIQSVVRCIEMGAEDYLTKPFDPVLLRARVGASLEKKRLRDEQIRRAQEIERAYEEAASQRRVAESLLENILPTAIAAELRERGTVEPRYFEDVTIMFSDFVGFTAATENLAAEELVNVLHRYFKVFDEITTRYGLEKLKTIGDSYMLAGGLPERSPSHPVDAVLAAFEMIEACKQLETAETPWKVRIGLHTGPVIAGVVGIKKFAFDIWGESVNFASRMESAAQPNRINVSSRTYQRVKDFFDCESRGKVQTKEHREFDMFFMKGIHPKLMDGPAGQAPPAFLRRYRVYFQKELTSFPGFLVS